MIRLLVCFSLCLQLMNGLFLYPQNRQTNCGEILSETEGVILPSGSSCEISIAVPEGSQFSLYLMEESGGRLVCKRITIIDDASGERFSMCDAFKFTGSSPKYTMKLRNLPKNIKVQIELGDREFKCGHVVPRSRAETPLIFVNDGGEPNCFLVVPTNSMLRVDPLDGEENECSSKIQISQGKHVAELTKSTNSYCLTPDGIETDVHCGLAVVFLESAVGTRVRISTSPSPSSKNPMRALYARYLNC